MPPSLNGPRIKLKRARTHADGLREEIQSYLASQPFTTEKAEETGSGDLVYRVRVSTPVPDDFGAMIGDVIHNARAALDLLIWQAVEANGGTPGKSTCFPFAKDEPSYQKTRGNALAGASADVFTLVDGLKPYGEGNAQLWRLHNLDILDKHRVLVPVGAAHRNVILTYKPPLMEGMPGGIEFPSLALRPADRLFPLQDMVEVYRVHGAARADLCLGEPDFTFEVAFGDGQFVDGEEVFAVLDTLVREVERVVDLFETHVFGNPAGSPVVPLPPKTTGVNTNTQFKLDELRAVMRPGSGTGAKQPIYSVTTDGVKHLCLFTAEDRTTTLLDHLKSQGIADAELFRTSQPAVWLDLLGCMEKQGISYVSLDCQCTGPGQLCLIAMPEMIRTITRAMTR